MKISNFRELREVKGSCSLDSMFFAKVDVETGWLFKKKTTEVISRGVGGSWFFCRDGKFSPGWSASELERAYRSVELMKEREGE